MEHCAHLRGNGPPQPRWWGDPCFHGAQGLFIHKGSVRPLNGRAILQQVANDRSVGPRVLSIDTNLKRGVIGMCVCVCVCMCVGCCVLLISMYVCAYVHTYLFYIHTHGWLHISSCLCVHVHKWGGRCCE